jgi:TolB protein
MDRGSFAYVVGLLGVLLGLAGLLAPAAEATYPGTPGAITYSFLDAAEGGTSGGLVNHGPREKQKPVTLTESAEDRAPAYSPNGRLIAFEGQREAGEPQGSHIYVMRSDGNGVRQLTEGSFYDSDPTFSPDGREIVFERSPIGNSRTTHLFEITVAGGEPTQLTSGSGHDSEAVFTPNGHSIIFVSDRDKSSRDDIYSMRPDGTEIQLLLGGSRDEDQPDVSPNGHTIVFASNSDNGRGPNLFLAPIGGSSRHAITHGRHNCFGTQCFAYPAFAPDGKHIAFVGIGRESSDLQVMRTDGRGFAKEFDEAGTEEEGYGTHIGAPAWGPVPR